MWRHSRHRRMLQGEREQAEGVHMRLHKAEVQNEQRGHALAEAQNSRPAAHVQAQRTHTMLWGRHQLPWHVPWPKARVQQEAQGQVQERGHALTEAQRPGVT